MLKILCSCYISYYIILNHTFTVHKITHISKLVRPQAVPKKKKNSFPCPSDFFFFLSDLHDICCISNVLIQCSSTKGTTKDNY